MPIVRKIDDPYKRCVQDTIRRRVQVSFTIDQRFLPLITRYQPLTKRKTRSAVLNLALRHFFGVERNGKLAPALARLVEPAPDDERWRCRLALITTLYDTDASDDAIADAVLASVRDELVTLVRDLRSAVREAQP